MNDISIVKMFLMTVFGLGLLAYDWLSTPFKKRIDPLDMTSEQRKSYLLRKGLK